MKSSSLTIKILSSLVVPVIAGITIFLLTLFLPDSFHLILISSLCYVLSAVSVTLFLFEEKRILRYTARICFLGSILFWIHLYFPVFYLYHIATALNVCLIIFYFGVAVASCIFCGKQNFSLYGWVFCSIMLCGFFHYLTLITLCYSQRLYSIFLFVGSTISLILAFYYLIDQKKYHFRYSKVVRYILMICSQLFLAASTILMIR